MKTAVYKSYGNPDVIHIEEVAKPIPKDDEVLVRVRAASVNPLDWRIMRGSPYSFRLLLGLRRPKSGRPGVDMAGEIEAIGKNVTQFKPGDAVFGLCKETLAEYVCAPESAMALKPEPVTFDQAASAPVAALTALQGLRDKGRLQPGQKVLINGASGGCGTFAVQIAKWLGAEVTGVCSTKNVELVRSLGADHVIDYTREDFTQRAERYDLLFDCMVNHSLSACRRVLKSQATLLFVGAPYTRWTVKLFARPIAAFFLSPFVRQRMLMFVAKSNKEDLRQIADLIATGKVRPVIDRRYLLTESSEAMRHLAGGHARGKVLITVE